MENNQNQLVKSLNAGETKYVDVKRIIPKNHPTINVLKFYNDIQNIVSNPIGQNLDCEV